MKKILITGAGSYIGTSFEVYAKAREKDWQIDTLDMLDGSWRGRSFAGYDAVFHVAGIAHQKETAENAHLYYEINSDLAIEVAKKAKADGVGQFVFLSSMSIYGRETGIITKETSPAPVTNYGKSKLQAEEGILPLADESFTVTVLRPPMVYGDGCRGNYNAIIRIVERFPVFPRVNNRRSMIHVDNLSSFVLMILRERLGGDVGRGEIVACRVYGGCVADIARDYASARMQLNGDYEKVRERFYNKLTMKDIEFDGTVARPVMRNALFRFIFERSAAFRALDGTMRALVQSYDDSQLLEDGGFVECVTVRELSQQT